MDGRKLGYTGNKGTRAINGIMDEWVDYNNYDGWVIMINDGQLRRLNTEYYYPIGELAGKITAFGPWTGVGDIAGT